MDSRFRSGRRLPRTLRKKPKQERSKATVEVIVEATTRIIEESGLAGLTTNHVARRAGVSVGSLYQYFPDKAALVEEVRARFAARFQSGMLGLLGRLPGLTLREALRAWVETVVDLHRESPGVHAAVGTGSPDDAREALVAVLVGYLDHHADDVRRPDRRLAAEIVMDAGEALVHNTALRDPAQLERPEWVAEVGELLERYLLADAAP